MKRIATIVMLGALAACTTRNGGNGNGGDPGNGGNGGSGGTATPDAGSPPIGAADMAGRAPADLAPPAANGCHYPAPPFGNRKTNTIDGSFDFQCYAPRNDTVTTLTLADLFDCDGSKGVNAISVDVSTEWCEACQTEAKLLNQVYLDRWKPLKAVSITLLTEDKDSHAPTPALAMRWRDTYKLNDVYVCIDPKGVFLGDGDGYPHNAVVDPRNMTVLDTRDGFGDTFDDTTVDDLAKKNAH
jgi:hypothetical protein